MYANLIDRFCTPPFKPLTDSDYKILAGAMKTEHPFENDHLTCYSWGKGKTVLLVHGWGSRASHMALIGRILASSGFRVIAFDAPAHSSSGDSQRIEKSNFFEFARAISSLSNVFGPFHAIVAHSLGATASTFAVAGHSMISSKKVSTKKLVLISLPVSIESLVGHFCRKNNLNSKDSMRLKKGLENEFEFSLGDFSVASVLKDPDADTLLIHDTNDEEFPIRNVYNLCNTCQAVNLFTTKGSGHQRILMNRLMIAKIKQYLMCN